MTELVTIQLDDIDPLTKTLIGLWENGKVREISLIENVLKALQEYKQNERKQSKL